jgi:hypothetical protein
MRQYLFAPLLSALPLVLGTSANAITFDDGQLHVIDAANSYPNDTIYVLDGPGSAATTVTVVDGGEAGTEPRGPFGNPTRVGIDATDNSLANIYGGEVPEVILTGTAFGTITGGRMEVALRLRGDAEATISGGDLGSKHAGPTIDIEDNARLTITGGLVQRAFTAFDNAMVDVTGGIFGEPTQQDCIPQAANNSTVRISGGEWGFTMPTRCTFHASGSAGHLIVVGSSFNHPFGQLTGFGDLTGLLADGTPLDVVFATADGGLIFLTPETATACDDGLDNDRDGTIDWNGGPLGEPADPGCADGDDLSERSPVLVCDDGIDNDGDELIDYPADPGCFNPSWFTENPQCQDGINNDPAQDGWIDFDGGVSAGVPPEWQTDPDPQCVGPYDNNERCGLGAELALLLPPLMRLYRRRSRRG